MSPGSTEIEFYDGYGFPMYWDYMIYHIQNFEYYQYSAGRKFDDECGVGTDVSYCEMYYYEYMEAPLCSDFYFCADDLYGCFLFESKYDYYGYFYDFDELLRMLLE